MRASPILVLFQSIQSQRTEVVGEILTIPPTQKMSSISSYMVHRALLRYEYHPENVRTILTPNGAIPCCSKDHVWRL